MNKEKHRFIDRGAFPLYNQINGRRKPGKPQPGKVKTKGETE
jgi:hypothetical protein